MPKKKKQSTDSDEHEGRPKTRITFGDFLVVKKSQGKSKHVASIEKQQQDPLQSPAAINIESEEKLDTATGQEVDSTIKESIEYTANLEPQLTEVTSPKVFICRTKKGGVPVKVENRSSGKKVTLIEYVLGDGKALLSVLKTKFGTGGQLKDDCIELQGDLLVKVSKYLNENKKLLRPYGTKL